VAVAVADLRLVHQAAAVVALVVLE